MQLKSPEVQLDQELKNTILVPFLPPVSVLHISVWASFAGRFSHFSGKMSSLLPHSSTLGLDPTDFKIQQEMLEDPRVPTKVLGMIVSSLGITFAGHVTVPIPSLRSLAWRMFLWLFESKPLPGVRVELTFSQITWIRVGGREDSYRLLGCHYHKQEQWMWS